MSWRSRVDTLLLPLKLIWAIRFFGLSRKTISTAPPPTGLTSVATSAELPRLDQALDVFRQTALGEGRAFLQHDISAHYVLGYVLIGHRLNADLIDDIGIGAGCHKQNCQDKYTGVLHAGGPRGLTWVLRNKEVIISTYFRILPAPAEKRIDDRYILSMMTAALLDAYCLHVRYQ
jgi:hypothetical protein